MKIRLLRYSYRFAEQVINSKLQLKNEIEDILFSVADISELTRPKFNSILNQKFSDRNWITQPNVFEGDNDPAAKLDFLKERIGIEVAFGHASFIGIDLLKFQIASYSGLDRIDLGVYITTTRNFQRIAYEKYSLKWEGSLTFEKVERYLPHFKSAIQVPIYVIGIDL